MQPVIYKETLEPHVTHTIVPIHETHHNRAQIHNTTTLPPVTMAEFKKNRGEMLERREQRFADFKGQPEDLGGLPAVAHRSLYSDKGPADGTFHGDFEEPDQGNAGRTAAPGALLGAEGARLSHPVDRNQDSLIDGTTNSGSTNIRSNSQTVSRSTGALPGAAAAAAATAMSAGRASEPHRSQPDVAALPMTEARRPRADSAKGLEEIEAKHEGQRLSSASSRSSGSNELRKKPSLLKRLNPLVDADGDGKKGFMS